MESCSLCTPQEIIDTRPNVLDQSKDIPLPYYREIVDFLPSESPKANYTKYHLFCLNKNISSFICEIDSAYEISFSAKENVNAMVIVMDIYKGGERVVLSDDIIKLIKSNINKYIELYPYCLVYDTSMSEFPKEWLDGVSSEIKCGMYKSGCIFLNLEGIANFSSKWDDTYEKIRKTLNCWYKEGVISLNKIKNPQNFILDWNLQPINNKLYKPVWEYNFTPDKVKFLLEYARGDNRFILYIGENNSIKNREGWIITTTNNYNEVKQIIDSILVN